MSTPLLTLKDIGKIYVTDGNVAVGIRGVNLSFERGEFVAVTGKSGSGKSTLLNVISGMDSYEEGELYIDGQSTSHYLQSEWEEYREKYVSFIFQDYNIIESFTVLQNVELALLHIENKHQRRRRALELLERVGLSSHLRQKGSRLSGGQKQRTVIARALAKDAPIILADEPTGNLDSATSAEIIQLLREVSRDKLLIMVTHNFDQVEAYATRHIRIFDGAVESDHALASVASEPPRAESTPVAAQKALSRREQACRRLGNGLTLGRAIFAAKPRLSVFLCLLMLIGTLGIFAVTALCGEAAELFEPSYMFNPIDGRVVLTQQSGEVITDEQLAAIAAEYGAVDTLHYDLLLDEGSSFVATLPAGDGPMDYEYVQMECTYGESFGEDILGRYPERAGEVLLYLPISYRPIMGEHEILISEMVFNRMSLTITGVKYYYDNNLTPKCLLTEEGFRTVTAIHYMLNRSSLQISLAVTTEKPGNVEMFDLYAFTPSFDMPADRVYIDHDGYRNLVDKGGQTVLGTTLTLTATYRNYNYYWDDSVKTMTFARTFTDADLTDVRPNVNTYGEYDSEYTVYISDELLCEIAEAVLSRSYTQASLFFESNAAARAAARGLRDQGYMAVPANTTYEPDAFSTIVSVLSGLSMAAMWLLAVIFLAFFVNLCSARTLAAFRGDMAIMRSMGIGVRVIRIGMYVRMLLSLIPAFVLVALTAVLIFTTPAFNEYFTYLYAWQYALIYLGMLILTVRTTHKQIRRLFGQSVKKALRGGSAV